MRVKMNTLSAGPNGVYPIGAELEVSEAEGRALVAGTFAVLAGDQPGDDAEDEGASDEPGEDNGEQQPAGDEGRSKTAARTRRK